MSWQTVACCRDCWQKHQPGREPTRLTTPEQEQCFYCGKQTSDGIYIRANVKGEQ